MHRLDIAVIVVYLTAILSLGFVFGRNQSRSEFFLAGGSMSWLAVGLGGVGRAAPMAWCVCVSVCVCVCERLRPGHSTLKYADTNNAVETIIMLMLADFKNEDCIIMHVYV